MEKTRDFFLAGADKLRIRKEKVRVWQEQYPEGSYGYQSAELEMAFIDVKIAIWEALAGVKTESERR